MDPTKLLRQLLSIKRSRLFGILAIFLVGFIGLQALASAQENEPTVESESITGTLDALNEEGEKAPVSNVSISVYLENSLIGKDTSDAEGSWIIEVPGPGTYRVLIDTNTLPEGLDLSNPEQEELSDVRVRDNQQKRVIFRLGESAGSGISRVENLSNLFLSGLRLGAIIAMAGAGLSITYSVTKLMNFAYGELITLGALIAFLLSSSAAGPGWHLLIAIFPALFTVAFFSASLEVGLWAPLRKKETSELTLMVISIGVSLALRHFYLIIFDSKTRFYEEYSLQDTLNFLSFSTTPKTLYILGITLFILLIISFLLLFTKHGTSIRALADNPNLAKASGINTEQTIQLAWIIGTITTGLSGVFLGITQGVSWNMGWEFLLIVFAGVILGGASNPFGSMVGGLMVGIFVEMSTYWIPPELKTVIALLIMSLTLLLRPQGITGWKVRTA